MVHCLSFVSIGLLLTLTQALPLHHNKNNNNNHLVKRAAMDHIYYNCINSDEIALTFDDGPYEYTEGLFEYLKSEGVTATFFINGNNYWGDNPGKIEPVLKKAIDYGFEIGSHTFTHADLEEANAKKLYDEIHKNEIIIHNAIHQYPAVLRPPYGNMNENNAKQLEAWGYTIVNWSIDIEDSLSNTDPSTDAEMNEVISGLAKDKSQGHIILSHDVREHTAKDFARAAIPYLRDQGFKLVTVSECLNIRAYKDQGISSGSNTNNSDVEGIIPEDDTRSEPQSYSIGDTHNDFTDTDTANLPDREINIYVTNNNNGDFA